MAKQRKLQGEMEATLKKITEGVEEWEELWNKYERSHDMDAAQRDRLVAEMKRDLKKLQRLRESVRGWLASNEVRVAKDMLEKARRNIEIQMERFRMVEKDVKSKAHMGMGRDALDPIAAAKQQCADWLTDVMDRLQTEIESCEADVENIGPTSNKAKKNRVGELQTLITRHQYHVTRLEQTLRLLRNDQVEAEEVYDALRENLESYLDSGGDQLDQDEDEMMYQMLPLEEVDSNVGKIAEPITPKPAAPSPTAEAQEPKKVVKPVPMPVPAAAAKPTPIKVKPVAVPAKVIEPIKPSAASAPATATPAAQAAAPLKASPRVTAAQIVAGGALAGKQAGPSAAAPPAASAQQPAAGSSAAAAKQAEPTRSPRAPAEEEASTASVETGVAGLSLAPAAPEQAPAKPAAASFSAALAHGAEGPARAGPSDPGAAPVALQDPGLPVLGPLQCVQALHRSLANRPTAEDAIWRDSVTGACSGLDEAAMAVKNGSGTSIPFEKLKDDALFFAFYFQSGTLQQAAAIKELHARGWIWHSTLHAWLTRAEQPKTTTAAYEQGVFCFWDPELRPAGEAGQTPTGWSSHLTAPTFTLEYHLLDTAVV